MATNLEITDIHSLPSILIPERDNLPQTGGIYFVLTENNNIEYIGKAKNIHLRWRKHECCMNLDSPKTCRVAWIEVPSENERTEIEKQLIRKFSPKHNANYIVKISKPNFVIKPAKVLLSQLDAKHLKASEVAKKLDVASITVRKWLLAGLFPNARLEETVAGKIWLIPENDLASFIKPERGRPAKAKENKK